MRSGVACPWVVLALVSASFQPVEAQEPGSVVEAWTAAEARFRAAAAEHGAVGAVLVLARGGEVLGRAHHGLADLASERPVDADTIFHWASITKTLTAVAAMQLVERGKLSLDDAVADYLPEVRRAHNPFGSMESITVRHLITHTSGFRGSTFPWGGDEEWHPHEPTDWAQVAAMMPYTRIEFEPGSRYSYSNPGYSMLGRIVEEVSGDHIEIYVTKNILMPLGMTRSYFDRSPYHLLPHRSNNYFQPQAGPPQAQGLDFDTGATSGNGGLNAPVADILRWLNFWLDVDDNGTYGTVLPRATLEAMWKPVQRTANAAFVEHMGQGFFRIDAPAEGASGPRHYVGHTGSQKAFLSFVYVEPATGCAVIFASNTTNVGSDRETSLFGATRRDALGTLLPAAGAGGR